MHGRWCREPMREKIPFGSFIDTHAPNLTLSAIIFNFLAYRLFFTAAEAEQA